MRTGCAFVQFYFGLPLAKFVICAVFVPIYLRLNVYIAHKYLEQRFDVRVRTLGAVLFLRSSCSAAWPPASPSTRRPSY